MTALLLQLACTSPSAPVSPSVPAPRPERAEAVWVERTDAELEGVIQAACTRATEAGQPVLLAFGAPWCVDCRKVHALEQQAPLQEELAGWTQVVVNVGRFDRHEALLKAFEVGSIAHWVALEPDCTAPISAWKRLRTGVLEPASNPEGPRTAADLTAWLVAARTP